MKNPKIILMVSIFALVGCKQAKSVNSENVSTSKKEITLTKLWETDTLLKTCESVRYDVDKKSIYVSNIGGVPPSKKDGDGSISIINLDGKIINQNWTTGIDAPKGIDFFNEKLYVADIDAIVRIDKKTGVIEKKYPVSDAIFLNDVAIDSNGDVYVTDSKNDKIYKLVDDAVSVWMALEGMNPNGVLVEDSRILVVSSSKGDFISIDKKTKEQTILATGIVGGDGIVSIKEGYIISAWQGEIYFVEKNAKSEGVIKILDTKDQKLNTADIGIIPEKNILLVPTFFGNKVVAYKIDYK